MSQKQSSRSILATLQAYVCSRQPGEVMHYQDVATTTGVAATTTNRYLNFKLTAYVKKVGAGVFERLNFPMGIEVVGATRLPAPVPVQVVNVAKVPSTDAAVRFKNLEALNAAGLITADEYRAKRQSILQSI